MKRRHVTWFVQAEGCWWIHGLRVWFQGSVFDARCARGNHYIDGAPTARTKKQAMWIGRRAPEGVAVTLIKYVRGRGWRDYDFVAEKA